MEKSANSVINTIKNRPFSYHNNTNATVRYTMFGVICLYRITYVIKLWYFYHWLRRQQHSSSNTRKIRFPPPFTKIKYIIKNNNVKNIFKQQCGLILSYNRHSYTFLYYNIVQEKSLLIPLYVGRYATFCCRSQAFVVHILEQKLYFLIVWNKRTKRNKNQGAS